eukprot:CAMPEP_0196591518 /NCGR_PEP_ID=MMETSP1081-20130531/69915_1 /TAXON_ID=36882 /ORGANISM="Pyramimonas amylifera, Strain CCMP720" /LENGTH=297 /DNA_ID=CAMNT_0041914903 /DNA_START=110 /DNA_END=1000 /DNA_ORIENTATION=-
MINSSYTPKRNAWEHSAYIDLILSRYSGSNSSKMSVLSSGTKNMIKYQPYTHIVVQPALPEDLYTALDMAFPSVREVLHAAGINNEPRQNSRHKIQSPQALKLKPGAENLNALWQKFVEYHVSPEFYAEVVALFRSDMVKSQGNVLTNSKGFRGLGVRSVNKNPRPSVVLDCQISVNTPTHMKSSVRGAHLDADEEIYGGLLYMRDKDDPSTGGDLNVFECTRKGGCPKLKPKVRQIFFRKGLGDTQFDPKDLKIRGTVPYKANTFVLFINSGAAFHAVTPRTITKFPRRFINIVAQ